MVVPLMKIGHMWDSHAKTIVSLEHLKIYYDFHMRQYRHRHTCSCGKELGCFCYDSIWDAIEAAENGLQCSECCTIDFIHDTIFEDDQLLTLIEGHEGNDELECLLTAYWSVDDGELVITDALITKNLLTAIRRRIVNVVNELKPETVHAAYEYAVSEVGYFDFDFTGHACEV